MDTDSVWTERFLAWYFTHRNKIYNSWLRHGPQAIALEHHFIFSTQYLESIAKIMFIGLLTGCHLLPFSFILHKRIFSIYLSVSFAPFILNESVATVTFVTHILHCSSFFSECLFIDLYTVAAICVWSSYYEQIWMQNKWLPQFCCGLAWIGWVRKFTATSDSFGLASSCLVFVSEVNKAD